ncbi:MAG TPA: flavin reductase family protein [Pirellulaceae bacterium]|nr:flavin reductase family protein [Pirellulaceae bacterium]
MTHAIVLRPIAWVSTISHDGNLNLAPFSYFNGVCSKPAALSFSSVNRADGSKKDTVVNIEATRHFVVNAVSYTQAVKMHQTSAEFSADVSEFEEVGLTPVPSMRISPPRVAESPIQFECELLQIVPIGHGPFAANLVIGKIVLIHLAEDVLDSSGKIQPDRFGAIGRMGGLQYCKTDNRFDLPKVITPPMTKPQNL